jgi:Yip1 domain
MLEAFYATVFRPQESRVSTPAALLIGPIAILILTFNAAGAFGAGAGGLIALLFCFSFAALVGVFWLSAAVYLLARWVGGQGTVPATLAAVTQGLWPLIFTGPAIAAAQWSSGLGALFSAVIALGTYVTLILAISQAHQISWPRGLVCVAITLMLSFAALFGLLLWPLMVFAGM